jgi:hypothetical protein
MFNERVWYCGSLFVCLQHVRFAQNWLKAMRFPLGERLCFFLFEDSLLRDREVDRLAADTDRRQTGSVMCRALVANNCFFSGGVMSVMGGGPTDGWNAPHMIHMRFIEAEMIVDLEDIGACSGADEAVFYLHSYREQAAGPPSADGVPSYKVLMINIGGSDDCAPGDSWFLSTTFGSRFEDNVPSIENKWGPGRFVADNSTEPYSIMLHRCQGALDDCKASYTWSTVIQWTPPGSTMVTHDFTASIGMPDANGLVRVAIHGCDVSTSIDELEHVVPPKDQRAHSSFDQGATAQSDPNDSWVGGNGAEHSGEWMQLELQEPIEIVGVATLCGNNVQQVGGKVGALEGGGRCVVEFKVSTSADGVTWTDQSTEAHRSQSNVTQWVVSSKGVQLDTSTSVTSCGVAYDGCEAKATAENADYFAWSGAVYNGCCQIQQVGLEPQFVQSEPYQYKLYEQQGRMRGFVAPATTYTDVATPNLFDAPVLTMYVRLYPLAIVGDKLSMRAALIRQTPLQPPAAADCTNVEGTVGTSSEWVVSTAGYNLDRSQTIYGGGISLDACKALAEEQTTKYFAWSGEIYNGYCSALKIEFAACVRITQDSGYGYQLYERPAGIPTGEGIGSECNNLVIDGSCTHLCLEGYVDNNGGHGQTYSCPDHRLVGTPLTCKPEVCNASLDPDNGSVAARSLAFGRYIIISRNDSYINLAEVEAAGGTSAEGLTLLGPTAASLSSTYASLVAAYCIDGSRDNMCHSDGASPWLVLDYGKNVEVLQITVANRIGFQSRIVGSRIQVVTEEEYNHSNPVASATSHGWTATFETEREVYTFSPPERSCTDDLQSGDSCTAFCNRGFAPSGMRSCLNGKLTDSFVCQRSSCPAEYGHAETEAGQVSTVGCDDDTQTCRVSVEGLCPTKSRACDANGNWGEQDTAACTNSVEMRARRGLRGLMPHTCACAP